MYFKAQFLEIAFYELRTGIIVASDQRLVSWFERSGQAGPHRTLVNRLMSCTLDQVSSPKVALTLFFLFKCILNLI